MDPNNHTNQWLAIIHPFLTGRFWPFVGYNHSLGLMYVLFLTYFWWLLDVKLSCFAMFLIFLPYKNLKLHILTGLESFWEDNLVTYVLVAGILNFLLTTNSMKHSNLRLLNINSAARTSNDLSISYHKTLWLLEAPTCLLVTRGKKILCVDVSRVLQTIWRYS